MSTCFSSTVATLSLSSRASRKPHELRRRTSEALSSSYFSGTNFLERNMLRKLFSLVFFIDFLSFTSAFFMLGWLALSSPVI